VSIYGYGTDIYVSGNFAYAVDWSVWYMSAVLYIADVSNPAAPFITSYEKTWEGYNVHASGNYVYVAGLSKLLILDVSNPP